MELIGVGNATSCTCLELNDGYMDTFWMRGLDFENFGNGLNFSANGANQCGLVDAYVEDVIVDAPNNYGLTIGSSSPTGGFGRIKFRNLWITTSGANAPGLSIGISGGATLSDLTFFGCNFSGTNFAAVIGGSAGNIISDVAFEFCQFYLSPTAIAMLYTNNLSFLNCSFGAPNGGGAGQVLQTANTNTNLFFQGNRVTGYTGFFGGSGLSSVGAGSLIASNLGVNLYGALTAADVHRRIARDECIPIQRARKRHGSVGGCNQRDGDRRRGGGIYLASRRDDHAYRRWFLDVVRPVIGMRYLQ